MIVIELFKNVTLQIQTIIPISTEIISLAEFLENKITPKKYTTLLTFNFAPVLFTNRKSDFFAVYNEKQTNGTENKPG